MTRGRRKDLTIPPSRALLQQRDYRARKAQYLADLEERVRRAEGENNELKHEVDHLKSRMRQENGGPSAYGRELAEASTELMQNLAAASVSLDRFRTLALDRSLYPTDIRMDVDEPMPSSRALPPPRAIPAPNQMAMPTLSSSTSARPPPPPGYVAHSHSSQTQYQPPRPTDQYGRASAQYQTTHSPTNYTLHPSRSAGGNPYVTPSQSNNPSPYPSSPESSRATTSPQREQLPPLAQLNLLPRPSQNQHSYHQPARMQPDPNPPYPAGRSSQAWASASHARFVSPEEPSDSESDDEEDLRHAAPPHGVGRLSLVTSDARSPSSTSSTSGSGRA